MSNDGVDGGTYAPPFVPAIRAARTSTISALADSAYPPRRRRLAIAVSRRLPVPLLLGVRLAARRPRRSMLAAVSIGITATTIVAVLTVHAHQVEGMALTVSASGLSALANPRYDRINQVLLVLTITLAALAAINAIVITQATAADARHSSSLARALGASPDQIAAALSVAQLVPALPGALLGIPAGLGLVKLVSHGGTMTVPPTWWLAAIVAGLLAGLAVLTAIPARIDARRSPAEILQSETA